MVPLRRKTGKLKKIISSFCDRDQICDMLLISDAVRKFGHHLRKMGSTKYFTSEWIYVALYLVTKIKFHRIKN